MTDSCPWSQAVVWSRAEGTRLDLVVRLEDVRAQFSLHRVFLSIPRHRALRVLCHFHFDKKGTSNPAALSNICDYDSIAISSVLPVVVTNQ